MVTVLDGKRLDREPVEEFARNFGIQKFSIDLKLFQGLWLWSFRKTWTHNYDDVNFKTATNFNSNSFYQEGIGGKK